MALGFLTGRKARLPAAGGRQRDQEQDDLYGIANLFPRTSGLPMVVWVSPRGRTGNDARIEVSGTPGRMAIGHTAVVGSRPSPRLIEGDLAPGDLALVARWITLNEDALIDFWNETIDSVELGGRLRKV